MSPSLHIKVGTSSLLTVVPFKFIFLGMLTDECRKTTRYHNLPLIMSHSSYRRQRKDTPFIVSITTRTMFILSQQQIIHSSPPILPSLQQTSRTWASLEIGSVVIENPFHIIILLVPFIHHLHLTRCREQTPHATFRSQESKLI